MPREDLIKFRRGLSTEWTSANPTLSDGELGYETDTRKRKVGDGTTNWNNLPYLNKGILADSTDDIGTVIPLDTIGGHNCNFESANTNVTFTLDTTDSVVNTWAQVLINTATEPSIEGATQEGGIGWTASTNLYLTVRNKGDAGIVYYFSSLAVNTGASTPTLQQVTEQGATTDQDVTFEAAVAFEDEVVIESGNISSSNNTVEIDKIIMFDGYWNASTNSPTLANGINVELFEYKVSVAGSQDFGAGSITFALGDIVANDGSIWYKKVDNQTTSLISTNGGAFTGALALDNSVGTYYDDYDLSVSGSITFTEGGSSTIGSYDLFKVVSNGITELTDFNSVNTLFRIKNGFPENRILSEGTHFIIIYKTNVGLGISINDWVAESDIGSMPFPDDVLLYIDTQFSDQVTEDVNGVIEVVNKADNTNNLVNTTGLNQPTYNAVTKQIEFDSTNDDILTYNDIFVNLGSCMVTYVLEPLVISNNSNLALSKPSEGSSLKTFYFNYRGDDLRNEGIYDNGLLLQDNLASRDDTLFENLTIVTMICDSVSGTWSNIVLTDIAGQSYTRDFIRATASTQSFPLNRIEIFGGTAKFGVHSIVVHNGIFTVEDAKTVQNFLAPSVNLTPWS
mgnify:CR=1 FL=1